jgi:hypothetical protein
MHIRFVTGQSMQLTWREMLSLFRHPLSIALVLVALIIFVGLKPHAVVVPQVPLFQMSFLWANSIIGFYAIYLIAIAAAERWGFALWTLPLLVVVSLYQTLGGQGLLVVMGFAPVSIEVLVQLALFHLIILSLIEVVFSAFVLPRIHPGLISDPAQDLRPVGHERSQRLTVVLLGQKFAVADLRVIIAQEHYVEIITTTEKHLLRGRISDIEAQLPPELGLRVHRSYWVATEAVSSLQRGTAWELHLNCGNKVPVARARREVVRAWVEGLRRG